jgi:polyhydroxybutyrate depolymerase
MNGSLMALFSGLNAKADEAGFLAVYPDGTGCWWSYFWNVGDCCGPPVREGVDDVAFIDALLDDLAGAYSVDPKRDFAAGMSNGAMMAYRLASELSGRIPAVATVAGTMATEGCSPTRPVPVLHVHGA